MAMRERDSPLLQLHYPPFQPPPLSKEALSTVRVVCRDWLHYQGRVQARRRALSFYTVGSRRKDKWAQSMGDAPCCMHSASLLVDLICCNISQRSNFPCGEGTSTLGMS